MLGVWRQPELWGVWLGASLLLTLVTSVLLSPTDVVGWKVRFIRQALQPLCLAGATLGLFLYADADLARLTIIVGTMVLLGLYWETVRRSVWSPERCYPEEREDIAFLLKLAIILSLSDFLYRLLLDPTVLPIFLEQWVFALTTGLVLVASLASDLVNPWLGRYEREHPAIAPRARLVLVITPLLIGEMFWVVNFLPASPDVKAFLVTMTAYLIQNIARSHFDGTLTAAQLRRYAYLGGGVLLFVLVTARWVV